jgi:hypothetical protein
MSKQSGHPGRMEALRGRAKMSIEKVPSSTLRSRYSDATAKDSAEKFNNRAGFKTGSVYASRKALITAKGPRRTSSANANKGFLRKGGFTKGGIDHSSADIVD